MQDLADLLASDRRVRTVTVDAEQRALHRLAEMLQQQGNSLTAVSRDTLPPSVRVELVDPAYADEVMSDYVARQGVVGVVDRTDALGLPVTLVKIVRGSAAVWAIVQLAAAAALTFNAVRQTAETRRDELTVMRLVGAGRLTVAGPYIIEANAAAVIATIAASAASTTIEIAALALRRPTTMTAASPPLTTQRP